ncbi:hypothetical protein [Aminobacter sp. LjRoot7]|uniref:hypothetical protein n=1 Tax=Aminobacter sp. LjRoot7 TaxID=3342335 RepID=UPI003ECC1D9F
MKMSPAGETRIWTTLDFDRDGKQHDWLRLPFSTDQSAYGVIPIPITCIRNGVGPTALLIAGNHGDEYEGQVALGKLARRLEPLDMRGRILILPALNYPAVVAGTPLPRRRRQSQSPVPGRGEWHSNPDDRPLCHLGSAFDG